MCEDYNNYILFIFFMSHRCSIFSSLYPLSGQAELYIKTGIFENQFHEMMRYLHAFFIAFLFVNDTS